MTAALLRLLLLIGLLAGLPACAAPQRVQDLEGWADDAGRASLADVLALPPAQWRTLPPGRVVEQPQQAAYWSDLGTQAYWLRLRLPPRPSPIRPALAGAAPGHRQRRHAALARHAGPLAAHGGAARRHGRAAAAAHAQSAAGAARRGG